MTAIISGRKTVDSNQDLVVFLIGARINKWWLLPLALPILAKMRAMQKELLADPDSGLVGLQNLGSATLLYFRSVEALMSYAEDKSKEHQPAAKRFFQKIFKNEAIGIWHETYVIRAGEYESIYTNMPPFGLGKSLPLLDAVGERATGRQRLALHGESQLQQVKSA